MIWNEGAEGTTLGEGIQFGEGRKKKKNDRTKETQTYTNGPTQKSDLPVRLSSEKSIMLDMETA